MKNKRIFMLMFIVGLFAIMLFINPNKVHAAANDNVVNNTLEVTTKIERWTRSNDLIFIKNDDWGGNSTWYTKTVWLRGTSIDTSETIEVQIQESDFELDDSDGKYKCSLEGWNYDNFAYGTDVYLVEKYDVSKLKNQDNIVPGETTYTNYYLPCQDRLQLSVNNNTIKSNSTSGYNNPANSYQLYIKCVYHGNPTEENRPRDIIVNMENSDEKVTTKSQGTINLPVYRLKIDSLTASGNMMPAGRFSIYGLLYGDGDYDTVDCLVYGTFGHEATSSFGSANGYIYSASEYSCFDYNFITTVEFDDPTDVVYFWKGTEGDIDACGQNLNGGSYSPYENIDEGYDGSYYYIPVETSISELVQDSNGSNTYVRTISGSISNSTSAPNGIFYNILPFAIAGILAVSGIILLKKNSIKE